MTEHPLETWHRLVRTQHASGLDALLADDAVFHSPVVHTPQRGRKLAAGYLSTAFHVFFNPVSERIRAFHMKPLMILVALRVADPQGNSPC